MSHCDGLPWRTDLAPEPDGSATTVASICHISDLHVLDAASPMRFEWIETLAHDPRWRPLLHMHRPQEGLVPWALAAHLGQIRQAPTGSSGAPLDLVVSTGDNIDNAQRNELDVYLSLVAGGETTLPMSGGPQDAGPNAADWTRDRPWPYWSPLSTVEDTWKALGYPAVDHLLERTTRPLVSPGIGVPWTSMPGNHDLLCQGTAFVNHALRDAATGSRKALFPPPDFEPDDPLTLFVDAPDRFLGHGDRTIRPDPTRRGITLDEWIAAHADAGARGWSPDERRSWNVDVDSRADAVVDLGEVVVVILDTNHPHGDYQGSVGTDQLDWLEHVLGAADRDHRLVVLASHHGPASLVNERGHDPSRRLAAAILDTVHRHPSVVLWLTGHRHVHRITPWAGAAGGFWEITTASIIDWPSERRLLEIRRNGSGTIEILTTVHPHDAPPDSLAWWHRELAQRFSGSQVRGAAMAGGDGDRNVRLSLAR